MNIAPLPLAGRCVWLTRPHDRLDALSDAFARAGADVVASPAIAVDFGVDTSALDAALRAVDTCDWIVLTSTRAIEACRRRADGVGIDLSTWASVRLAVVGPVTADALTRIGLRAAVVANPHSAIGLLKTIAPHIRPGSRVLYPRAETVAPTLTDGLRSLGARVHEVIAYRTVPASVAAPTARPDCVVFCSPSAVAAVRRQRAPVDDAVVACIGRTTARAAVAAGYRVDVIPSRATAIDLADAVVRHFAGGDR